MPTDPERRPRAARVDREVRRGLLIDAAEGVLAENDPLLVTFDEVAQAAGVSRALLHQHVGDRRGLVDAVQTRVLERLDRWVGHGLARSVGPAEACRSVVYGTWSFVEVEDRGWSVLTATGGLDHPAAHAIRRRWSDALADGRGDAAVAAQLAVGGLVAGVGGWMRRGVDVDDVHRAVAALLRDP